MQIDPPSGVLIVASRIGRNSHSLAIRMISIITMVIERTDSEILAAVLDDPRAELFSTKRSAVELIRNHRILDLYARINSKDTRSKVETSKKKPAAPTPGN